MRLFLVSSQIR